MLILKLLFLLGKGTVLLFLLLLQSVTKLSLLLIEEGCRRCLQFSPVHVFTCVHLHVHAAPGEPFESMHNPLRRRDMIPIRCSTGIMKWRNEPASYFPTWTTDKHYCHFFPTHQRNCLCVVFRHNELIMHCPLKYSSDTRIYLPLGPGESLLQSLPLPC